MVSGKASSPGESVCFGMPPGENDAKQELIPGGQERDTSDREKVTAY